MHSSVLLNMLLLLTYHIQADSGVQSKKQIHIVGKIDLIREYLVNMCVVLSIRASTLASVRKLKSLTFIKCLPDSVLIMGSLWDASFSFWKRVSVNSPNSNVCAHRSLCKLSFELCTMVSCSVLQIAVHCSVSMHSYHYNLC